MLVQQVGNKLQLPLRACVHQRRLVMLLREKEGDRGRGRESGCVFFFLPFPSPHKSHHGLYADRHSFVFFFLFFFFVFLWLVVWMVGWLSHVLTMPRASTLTPCCSMRALATAVAP